MIPGNTSLIERYMGESKKTRVNKIKEVKSSGQ